MAVSERKKASNARWDAANLSTLSCRVRKEEADTFRALCKANNTTPYAVLFAVVKGALDGGKLPIIPSEGVSASGGVLTPAALETAAQAAQKTGETVPAFAERAVTVQAQRDGASLRMGINPATGEKMSRDGAAAKKAEAPDESEAPA